MGRNPSTLQLGVAHAASPFRKFPTHLHIECSGKSCKKEIYFTSLNPEFSRLFSPIIDIFFGTGDSKGL